jgi:hypothetical protein
LKKELGIDNPAGNPTYTPSIITKEEILDNHRSVYVLLEFQPKMKDLIYRHSTGFLNYISVLTNRLFLLDLPYSEELLKNMLEYIQSMSLSSCNRIKIFDFYTTIPHSKPRDRLRQLVQKSLVTDLLL